MNPRIERDDTAPISPLTMPTIPGCSAAPFFRIAGFFSRPTATVAKKTSFSSLFFSTTAIVVAGSSCSSSSAFAPFTSTLNNVIDRFHRHHPRQQYPHHHHHFRRCATTASMSSSSSSKNFEYNFSTDFAVPDLPSWMLPQRTRVLNRGSSSTLTSSDEGTTSCVLYWMQRDVRTRDNWALLLAQHYAQHHQVPLHVLYMLPSHASSSSPSASPPPLEKLPMTERYGKFLLDGLKCVHDELATVQVPFHVVDVDNVEFVPTPQNLFSSQRLKPLLVVTDMSPIRHIRQRTERFARQCNDDSKDGCPVYQVDAHNVVPVWYASPKREVGARTLRPKISKLADECLQYADYKKGNVIPDLTGNAHLKKKEVPTCPDFVYDQHKKAMKWDTEVAAVDDWAHGGTDAGMARFEKFVRIGLPQFGKLRNDPNYGKDICSHLSPWLNFGHVSFATLMRLLKTHNRDSEGKASFIEEGLVRRELSDNFLWYTPDDYDQLTGAAQWAQDTLEEHRTADVRSYTYTLSQFVNAQTHDDLWNASQLQLTSTGKLHGFLRMYWCKKILEWTESPAQALEYGQYLNDYFALDGRDPNGFVGVGWSIMGIHDMGWKEREIFGKIRFMNYAGCKRKFKVDEFVAKYPPAYENALEAGGTSASTTKRKVSPTSAAGTSKKVKAKATAGGKKE